MSDLTGILLSQSAESLDTLIAKAWQRHRAVACYDVYSSVETTCIPATTPLTDVYAESASHLPGVLWDARKLMARDMT